MNDWRSCWQCVYEHIFFFDKYPVNNQRAQGKQNDSRAQTQNCLKALEELLLDVNMY